MNEAERVLADQVFRERLWEDIDVRKPGDPPTNLSALYRDLGVVGKSFEVKRAAVEEWLKDNEPIGLLALQVKRENFGVT
ncbi:hypothetical protein F7230_04575 [Corynebacterium sp. 320]|uniref:hypothetical protein n=1 Tax=Corynebacterium TaxID=1716 RepID=UPI00125CC525|nr:MULTISPECIES: hypothetical protein [Corynebacterium]KAB1504357.1 hypothetical protein F7230_04575 [Corynebacterium sp. 320]KAB1552544.1 hypothetical protein F7233_02020 [Corynebacterium sp. 321]KAB3528493.1 hypothetical protein F8354_04575 [Corynebacterium sp. 250]QNP92034.1 hypothetical protein IAU67_08440 [Corynebacterium zhongnanshanii]